jgi:hypothetical protein
MSNKNYFFGQGSYDSVLDIFSMTKVNSEKTSSLPLAEFWNPRNKCLTGFIGKLKEKIGCDFVYENAQKFFEYPTYALDNQGKNIPYSKPSMTDLMIIDQKYQIAIESKYTEYVKSDYQTIESWRKDKSENSRKDEVLKAWCNYITNSKCTDISDLQLNSLNKTIPYQFLHRTASSCYQTEINGKIPVLIYQLFYDKKDLKKLNSFKSELEAWSKLLQLNDKIKFLIVSIPVKNGQEVSKTYKGIKSELFLRMKETSVYEFDLDENVLF